MIDAEREESYQDGKWDIARRVDISESRPILV